jgi:hypothetical protein
MQEAEWHNEEENSQVKEGGKEVIFVQGLLSAQLLGFFC